MVPVV